MSFAFRQRPVIVGLTGAASVLTVLTALTLGGCASAGDDSTPAAAPAAPAAHRQVASAPAAPSRAAATRPTPVSSPSVPATPAPPDPCARSEAPKSVHVDLARQHMWLCTAHRVALSTPVTSGRSNRDEHTPTGHFHIQGVNHDTVLNTDGREYDVRWWIPFQAPLFGFHDSPWQHMPYGSQSYRTRGSHGCVHVPISALNFFARWAGNWANRTIPVTISA